MAVYLDDYLAQSRMLDQPGHIHAGRDGADDERQEVILRALAKKITWWQVAEIIGISDRPDAALA